MSINKALDIILRVIFNLIPVLLMYLGKFEDQARVVYTSLGFCEESEGAFKLSTLMLISFTFGVFSIYAYYPIRFEFLKNRRDKEIEMLRLIAKQLRIVFSKTLGQELKVPDLKLNIRKYEIGRFYRKPWKEWLNRKMYCYVKNFRELCGGDVNDHFSFEVSPIPKGLVGVVYNNKDLMYDDKLSERMDSYNLNFTINLKM